MSGGQSRQADDWVMAHRGDCFQRHVAARYRPLIILLKHQRADETDHSRVVREDADDVGPALDLLVYPFQRVGGRDLRPVVLRERHVGENILARCVHHIGELGELLAQGIGDLLPLLMRSLGRLLRENRLDHGDHGGPLFWCGMGQRVAHPVHPAALLARGEHLAGSGAQSLVIIGDDQLDPAKAPIRQRTQEGFPEGLCLRRSGGDAQHFAAAIGVDANGDYRRPRGL